jgi:hypothetical protein
VAARQTPPGARPERARPARPTRTGRSLDGRPPPVPHGRGQNPAYEPAHLTHAFVAQRTEHRTTNPGVGSSILSEGTTPQPVAGPLEAGAVGGRSAGTPANFGTWRSQVARSLRERENAGSNPAVPTFVEGGAAAANRPRTPSHGPTVGVRLLHPPPAPASSPDRAPSSYGGRPGSSPGQETSRAAGRAGRVRRRGRSGRVARLSPGRCAGSRPVGATRSGVAQSAGQAAVNRPGAGSSPATGATGLASMRFARPRRRRPRRGPCSSTGRAAVLQTAGRGFNSLRGHVHAMVIVVYRRCTPGRGPGMRGFDSP